MTELRMIKIGLTSFADLSWTSIKIDTLVIMTNLSGHFSALDLMCIKYDLNKFFKIYFI